MTYKKMLDGTILGYKTIKSRKVQVLCSNGCSEALTYGRMLTNGERRQMNRRGIIRID